jgi:hypothetical protein
VKHVLLLQPSLMVRAGLALLYPFVSSKAHAKVKQVRREGCPLSSCCCHAVVLNKFSTCLPITKMDVCASSLNLCCVAVAARAAGASAAGHRGCHSRRGAGATPGGGLPHCAAAPEQGPQRNSSSSSTWLAAGWQQDSACTRCCAAMTALATWELVCTIKWVVPAEWHMFTRRLNQLSTCNAQCSAASRLQQCNERKRFC